MKIRYDVEKMRRIISDLSVLTGISMSFLNTERRTLCSSIKDNDYCSLLQLDEKNKNCPNRHQPKQPRLIHLEKPLQANGYI